MSTISGTTGSTSLFLKTFCWEMKRFSRCAWRVNDVVHPKTAGDREDLQTFSKHSRTPITPITRMSVSGLTILCRSPSPQIKLTDYSAAGNTETDEGRVDER